MLYPYTAGVKQALSLIGQSKNRHIMLSGQVLALTRWLFTKHDIVAANVPKRDPLTYNQRVGDGNASSVADISQWKLNCNVWFLLMSKLPGIPLF